MSTHVQLEIFEGPLDLLLHLIKKNEVSITDIPIAVITEQYLATVELMQTLNLDVAGEFLVMAATLIHIKSRMLLPADDDEPDEEEGPDPRAELVRRLLEYQRYKDAAHRLLYDAPAKKLPGGSGLAFDWSLLAGFRHTMPWGLAGGLMPDNIAEAIRLTGAELVDASSGLESAPGVKDVAKIEAFCRAARAG